MGRKLFEGSRSIGSLLRCSNGVVSRRLSVADSAVNSDLGLTSRQSGDRRDNKLDQQNEAFMIRKLVPLSVVVATLLCGAVYAQETTEAPETGSETGNEAGSEIGSDLDLGQSGPRIGEQYIKEQTGDWSISCIKSEGDVDPCAMVQVLNNQQGDPIAEVSIGKLPEGGVAVAWANVVVPLETLLQAQLAVSIDDAPRKLYNYHHCVPVGCIAQLGLTQDDIDAMKSGTKAALSLVPARLPDQILNMDMSLNGFATAFDGLNISIR